MIRFISYKNIDKTKWDACINQSKEGTLYLLSWYLDIVYQEWDAVIDDEATKYITVMPLPVKRKWGLKYVVQNRHTQQLGIISIKENVTPTYFHSIILKAKDNAAYIASYAFSVANSFFFTEEQFYLKAYTYYLNLNRPYSDLIKNYSQNQKRNIRNAAQNHLKIVESDNIQPLLILFKENTAHKFKGKFSEDEYLTIQALFSAVTTRGMGKLYYVLSENEICGGALFYFYKNRIIYQLVSSNEQGRKNNAASFLLDYIIKAYAGTHKILDFEGSAVPSLARFYGSFGSEPVAYNIIYYNRYKIITDFVKKLTRSVKTGI